jgi:hypothetical protein
MSVSFHHGSAYSYIIWGMNSRPMMATLQRHSLTPLTWTTTIFWQIITALMALNTAFYFITLPNFLSFQEKYVFHFMQLIWTLHYCYCICKRLIALCTYPLNWTWQNPVVPQTPILSPHPKSEPNVFSLL